ncbi:MAG: class I SAM-dependent methyltransferase [Betaproteobacteria bacterium]
MLPVSKIVWHESNARVRPVRRPEPETMTDPEQVRSYVAAYAWGGPTSALQLHHLRELSRLIRPGDVVVDLACGPGPLLLELAALYPDVTFIGVDLSSTMLDFLAAAAKARGLHNIEVRKEDIRRLPSLRGIKVDLVISTSALHHLPDEQSLLDVFHRIASLLRRDGGFYLFDFGLLKSAQARQLFVAEVAKSAPPATVRDYDLSLQAAFGLDRVYAGARKRLPRPFTASRSALVDFCYFLQSPPRATCQRSVQSYLDHVWSGLSMAMKAEHVMLRLMRTRSVIRPRAAGTGEHSFGGPMTVTHAGS